jgi:hypothetical protein
VYARRWDQAKIKEIIRKAQQNNHKPYSDESYNDLVVISRDLQLGYKRITDSDPRYVRILLIRLVRPRRGAFVLLVYADHFQRRQSTIGLTLDNRHGY